FTQIDSFGLPCNYSTRLEHGNPDTPGISKQPITHRAFKDRRCSPSADKAYISRRFHENREKFHIPAKINR
ncbi:hypothetical protein, partial [Burkholderia pseudomultivorans]|uniref:hypothetical protein n=1 Tax=Burkholderia pseudomultivorans TaxID=1207504 RepID=UPI001E366B42